MALPGLGETPAAETLGAETEETEGAARSGVMRRLLAVAVVVVTVMVVVEVPLAEMVSVVPKTEAEAEAVLAATSSAPISLAAEEDMEL